MRSIKSFKNKKVAIHTPSKEIMQKVLKLLPDSLNTSLSSYDWDSYKEKTCIALDPNWMYCEIDYWKRNDYEIISYTEILELNELSYEIY